MSGASPFRREFLGHRLHYSSLKSGWAAARIPLDDDDVLEVVGDPDNACYEWVIAAGDRIKRYSDCGYGCSALALRDGLIAYYGLPRSAADECTS